MTTRICEARAPDHLGRGGVRVDGVPGSACPAGVQIEALLRHDSTELG